MLSQQQSQKQHLKILPQQIHLLNIYFLNSQELQQRVLNELEENPFLEINEEPKAEESTETAKSAIQDFESSEEYIYDDIPDCKGEYTNYFPMETAPDRPIVSTITFKEEAIQQLHMLDLDKEDIATAEYLIGILNQHGMLEKTIEEITVELSFLSQTLIEEEKVLNGITIIQSLDPPGLGSRNIQECLLAQLRLMNRRRPDVRCAIQLLENYYTDLTHRQFEKILHKLKIDDDELRIVLRLIGNLNFYPVYEDDKSDQKNTIIPDFLITNNNDGIQVSLYSRKEDLLYVNQALYNQLACHINSKDKTTYQYLKNKINSAQWFVNAIKQREQTMMCIMQCIVNYQYKYFQSGDIRDLKPMVLRNIAEHCDLDIATISRITSNKYADTPFGLVYLKELFSEGIIDKQGEMVSSKVIQSAIDETIRNEDKKHPYTDQQLVEILAKKGYNVARRTVAKYRSALHLPIAQVRAVWA